MTLAPLITTSPASPSGAGWPDASTNRIVWPGRGRPTVPAFRLPTSGLTVLAHDPSDSPYPSMIGMPYRDSKPSSSSTLAGAAPHTAKRTEEVSGFTLAGRPHSIV